MAPVQPKETAISNPHQQKPILRHHPYRRNDRSELRATIPITNLNQQLSADEHAEGDRRILAECPWVTYKDQPFTVKQAMELVVLKSLLLKFGKVSYDTCSACLRDNHNDVRTLLLKGWEKGTFEALRNNSTFLSLCNSTIIRFSQEPTEGVSPERFNTIGNNAIISPIETSTGKALERTRGQDSMVGLNAAGQEYEGSMDLIEDTPENGMFEGAKRVDIYGGKFVDTSGGDLFNVRVAGDLWQITCGDSSKIARWFFDIDYRMTHNEVAKRRSKGTGMWFLQRKTYSKWCTSPQQRIMWCPGIPGVGKTVMTSLIVDHLRMFDESQSFVGVIYFNYKYQSQQSKLAIFEALCRQMFEIREHSIFQGIYDSHAKQKSRAAEDELQSALSNAFRHYRYAYLVLDALDEYTAQYSDKQVREIITDILSLGENVKLLITSRILGDMAATFKELGASRADIIADENDMNAYVGARVTSLKSKLDFEISNEFSAHIVKKVIEAAKGRFLVAELDMNLLAEQLNLGELEDALDKLPNEIDDTYVRVMELIKTYPEGRRELAMQALMWIAYSHRRLTVQDLQHALATKPGRKEITKYVTPLSTITSLCAGLIVVEDKKWNYLSDDMRFVRFVHFTTQEFFGKSQSDYFSNAHKEMFSTCIEHLSIVGTYILPADFSWISVEHRKRRTYLPFYDYAALIWGQHANTHTQSIAEEVRKFLLRNDRALDLSWEYALKASRRMARVDAGDGMTENGGSGAFLAAFHDQPYALPVLFDRIHKLPYTKKQRTPLHIAAIEGWTNAIKEILQWSRSSCDNKGPAGRDILTQPTRRQCKIRFSFLQNERDVYGRTPISYAAERGQLSAAKLLLEHGDIEVNLQDNKGRNPLWYAVQNRQEPIIKLLLEHGGINVNSKDDSGCTPFSYAAVHGWESVIKLLLEHRGTEVDSKDNSGRTPLSYAAELNKESIAGILLEHGGVEVNSKDNKGWTPLSYAAQHCNVSIAELLLRYEGIEVDSKDNGGRTPFSNAAQHGQKPILKLMLEHGVVDVDSKDNHGRTPLSHAAEHGQESTLRLLIVGGGAEVDSKDNVGRTPLSYAAENNKESIVGILLKHGGVEVNLKDNKGWTPFAYAAQRNNESTVKLLLGHKDIDVDSRDNCGRTPFSYMAGRGEDGIIHLLLRHPDVKVDSKDNKGRTPLSYAAENGEVLTTFLLLDYGGVEVDSKDINGRTPCSYAAQHGNDTIVDLLRQQGSVGVDLNDTDVHTSPSRH